MGKIRDTFRLVAPLPSTAFSSGESNSSEGPPTLSLPQDEGPAEVPFIEVGPRRHLEASADVLAYPGPKHGSSLSVASENPLPRPHHVQFKGLPQARMPRLAAELVAYHAPNDAASAEYVQLLATALLSAEARLDAPRVLLFIGTRPGVRTTTVVLNLAITAARQGRRCIVVDANLRRPAVAERLGLEAAPGLTEVLDGGISLTAALRPTAQDGLRVLTAGSPQALWLDAEELRGLLREAAREADLVLVDGPSWDGRAGASACAQASDVTFLVVPTTEVEVAPASELVRTLPARGVALAGCVLTAG